MFFLFSNFLWVLKLLNYNISFHLQGDSIPGEPGARGMAGPPGRRVSLLISLHPRILPLLKYFKHNTVIIHIMMQTIHFVFRVTRVLLVLKDLLVIL